MQPPLCGKSARQQQPTCPVSKFNFRQSAWMAQSYMLQTLVQQDPARTWGSEAHANGRLWAAKLPTVSRWVQAVASQAVLPQCRNKVATKSRCEPHRLTIIDQRSAATQHKRLNRVRSFRAADSLITAKPAYVGSLSASLNFGRGCIACPPYSGWDVRVRP